MQSEDCFRIANMKNALDKIGGMLRTRKRQKQDAMHLRVPSGAHGGARWAKLIKCQPLLD